MIVPDYYVRSKCCLAYQDPSNQLCVVCRKPFQAEELRIRYLRAKKSSELDEYDKSNVWIPLISEDGKRQIGIMQRCGITPPYYPERATYYQRNEANKIDTIYVYDGGYFWKADEWRLYWQLNGKSPCETLEAQ